MHKFKNVTEAFEILFDKIIEEGEEYANTKALFNVGFLIENPTDRIITTPWRKFNEKYAIREFEWYKSKDKSGLEISKYAPIWKNFMDKNGDLNSNYGYQIYRNGQWDYVKEKLKQKDSRHGVLTIYDGKEHNLYDYDKPCTIAINFYVYKEKLNMTILMRSNCLWYGFGNDQYCFSSFQEQMANELGIEVGTYFHFATNLHLYPEHQDKKKEYEMNLGNS